LVDDLFTPQGGLVRDPQCVWMPLALIRRKQRWRGDPLENQSQFPGQIVCILYAYIHPIPPRRRDEMSSISGQKDPPLVKVTCDEGSHLPRQVTEHLDFQVGQPYCSAHQFPCPLIRAVLWLLSTLVVLTK